MRIKNSHVFDEKRSKALWGHAVNKHKLNMD